MHFFALSCPKYQLSASANRTHIASNCGQQHVVTFLSTRHVALWDLGASCHFALGNPSFFPKLSHGLTGQAPSSLVVEAVLHILRKLRTNITPGRRSFSHAHLSP
ncbi:hypothetical protein D3C87_1758880 [compost metagenome]